MGVVLHAGPAAAALALAGIAIVAASRVTRGSPGDPTPPNPAAAASPAAAGPIGPGTVLEGRDELGGAVTFRIESIEHDPKDKDGDTDLYGVSAKDPTRDAWASYCGADADGVSKAIPVTGSWDATGAFHDGPSVITFACTSGAIAKCIRWGYKPWKTVDGVSLRPHHQACTRMVRADYCGNGRSHTRNGTRIDVFDRAGIQRPEPDPRRPEVFEAGWAPGGATYVSVARWGESLDELVRECPSQLTGRTSKDQVLTADDVAARFPATLVFDNRYVRQEDRLAR